MEKQSGVELQGRGVEEIVEQQLQCQRPKRQKKKDQAKMDKDTKPVLIGHDGRRIELDFGTRGSSSQSLQDENKCLKEAVRFFTCRTAPDSIPEEHKRYAPQDPREKIREQQKELNKAGAFVLRKAMVCHPVH